MASYIQGLTDVAVPIAPFQPDFGMMQKALSTLQARYEQGFASVKSAYNQVLNAPLSDAENKTVRDGFIKSAEQKLKNLSSVDLSIPENQATAEGVFAPFWEDNMILQDASLTKWYQGELQKAQTTRDSQDEKVRSQYSDAAVMYLENGLEKLQTAGRDASKYAKLEKRRFVPFQDMKAYLNEQAQKSGFKVEWESEEGPYLKKIENGERSTTAFATFAEDMLTDQFQDQARVMGVVEKETRIKNLKRLNPALTDDQALAMIAKDVSTSYQKALTSRTDRLQKELDLVTTKMKPYLPLGQLDTKQDKVFTELATRQAALEKLLENSKDHANDYKLKEQGILENPDGYFTSLMKQRTIDSWANARAASEKISYTLNPAWKENNDVARYQREFDFKEREYGLKLQDLNLKKMAIQYKAVKDGVLSLDDLDSDLFGDLGGLFDDGSGSGGSGFSGGGGGGFGGGGGGGASILNSLNPEKAGRYVSRGAVDVTKVGNPYQLFRERQGQRWGVAHEALFSDEATGRVLNAMGVSTADAVKYWSAMKNYSVDLSEEHLSQQDKTGLHDLTKRLLGRDMPGHAGFFELRTKLLDKMRTTLEDKLKDGGTGLTREDYNMLGSYATATWAIKEHDVLEEQRKKLVQQQITSNPKDYEKILVRKNGGYDVADVEDIVKDFKPIKLRNASTREVQTLNAREFAEMYINGGFTYAGNGEVFIDGNKFNIQEFNGQTGSFDAMKAFNNYYYDRSGANDVFRSNNPNALEFKYGSSQTQKDLRSKLNAAVVPNLPEYQSQLGKLGFVVRYDLAAKGKQDVGTSLIQEAAEAGNHMGIYVDGVLSKDDDMNAAIMKLMSQGEGTLKDYVSSALLKTGPNGRPALEVILQPAKSSDKTTLVDKELPDLANKKSIEFELNPDATGATLRKIRFNSGMYVFGSLLRGQPMSSDPMLKAAGFSFNITPNNISDPTGAIVEVQAREFVNGAYTDAPLKRHEYSFSQITPDELVNNFYGFFFQQLRKNIAAQQVYQKQMGQAGQGLRTPQEVMDAVRGR